MMTNEQMMMAIRNLEMNIPNPGLIEDRQQMDVYSRLLKDRIIYLGTQVVPASANMIVGQLLFLEMADQNKPIHLYINSPGGSVHDGLAIYDVMQHIKCEVHTIALGNAVSMGSLLLMSGEQGHRYAMPNANIMIHQPSISGGLGGQVTDIEIVTKNLLNTKNKLIDMYALHCNGSPEKFKEAMERDNYLTPKQALELGLIDHIIESPKTAKLRNRK